MQMLRFVSELQQRVSHTEKCELQEVPVMGVQRFDTMISKQGGQMGVRDKVSSGGNLSCCVSIDLPETLFFRQEPHVRKFHQHLDVFHGLLGRKRIIKNGRMRGNAQVAHNCWPSQVENRVPLDAGVNK